MLDEVFMNRGSDRELHVRPLYTSKRGANPPETSLPLMAAVLLVLGLIASMFGWLHETGWWWALPLVGAMGLRPKGFRLRTSASYEPSARRPDGEGVARVTMVAKTFESHAERAALFDEATRAAKSFLGADFAAVIVAGSDGLSYEAPTGWEGRHGEDRLILLRSSQGDSGPAKSPVGAVKVPGPTAAHSVLTAPLSGRGLPTAALVVWHRASIAFGAEHERTLARLADATAQAWQRLRRPDATESRVMRWADLVARVGAPLLVLDRDGRVVFANYAAGSLLGLAAHELVGENLTVVLSGRRVTADCQTAVTGILELSSDGGSSEHLDVRIESDDLAPGWQLAVLRDADAVVGEDVVLALARAVATRSSSAGSATSRAASSLDLRTLVLDTARRRARAHIRRAVVVSTDLPSVPATVSGDEERLRELLDELLENAEDAVVHAGDGRVVVTLESVPGGWRLRVDDGGPGVPYPLRAKVLEPYYSTKPDGEGGLGLTTAAAVVRQHGGSLTVGESQLGGARFEVVLPAS